MNGTNNSNNRSNRISKRLMVRVVKRLSVPGRPLGLYPKLFLQAAQLSGCRTLGPKYSSQTKSGMNTSHGLNNCRDFGTDRLGQLQHLNPQHLPRRPGKVPTKAPGLYMEVSKS